MTTELTTNMLDALDTPATARLEGAADLNLYGRSGQPQPSHVLADACGDAGLTATLRLLAEQQPAVIRAAIGHVDGQGCEVRLFARDAYGKAYPVQLLVTWDDVRNNLAGRSPCDDEPGDANAQTHWQIVLEEAYAWLKVMTMPRGSSAAQCHAALDRTSSTAEVLFALTGQAQAIKTQAPRRTRVKPAGQHQFARRASRQVRLTALLH